MVRQQPEDMKTLFALVLVLSLLGTFSPVASKAADAGKKAKKAKVTEEQKSLRKELLDKYDTNMDGKLDKKERAKISAEDQEKIEKAGLGVKAKKKAGAAEAKDAAKDAKDAAK